MSQELDQERGIPNDELVVVSSARGRGEKMAIVTPEFKPVTVKGTAVRQVEGLRMTSR